MELVERGWDFFLPESSVERRHLDGEAVVDGNPSLRIHALGQRECAPLINCKADLCVTNTVTRPV